MGVQKLLVILLRAVLTVLSAIFTPVTNWIFRQVYENAGRSVSPVTNEILLLPAVELANRIRGRQLKAVEVMESYITRLKEVNTLTNAMVAERFDDALTEAKTLDTALQNDPSNQRFSMETTPFLGVPMSVKEAFAVKGMPNCSGLVERKDYRCDSDCPVVSLLRHAGAIPMCVTNTSELCMWYESGNKVYGRTKNPYHTGRIVGGSSGGEGCNLASGAAVIGIGSDIGGSIRMPAFFNGVYGHRPSRGIVDNTGQFPLPTGRDMELLSSGPMCRYVDDLIPQLKVMAGPNANLLKLDQKVDIKTLRIFTVVDDGGSVVVSNIDPQLKAAQLKAVEFLQEAAGVEVKTVVIQKLKYSLDIWSAKMSTCGGSKFGEYMTNFKGKVNPYKELLKWLVGCSNHTLPAIALAIVENFDFLLTRVNKVALKGGDKLEKEMQDLLGDDGVMLYPSHPKLAPYHNQPLLYPFNFAYTGIFNALGLPVTQVPLGLSIEGLPLGVQVVTSMNNDRLALAVAAELSKGPAGWVNPGSQHVKGT